MTERKRYVSNFGMVELCVTYRCNVKCDNCSNLCTQAPFNGDLSARQVEDFLQDNIESGHTWGQITIHGGEPVLNPEIEKIVEVLTIYRKNTGCNLWLLTNNSSDDVRERATRINVKYGVALGISTKRGKNISETGSLIEYVAVNESPEDLGLPHDHGCFQTANCGVCYNYLGYFPCSPMAAAAKVFGYAPSAKSFLEFTQGACDASMDIHCRHCGFSTPERKRVVHQTMTPTWRTALFNYGRSRYKERPCELITT